MNALINYRTGIISDLFWDVDHLLLLRGNLLQEFLNQCPLEDNVIRFPALIHHCKFSFQT